MLGPGEECGLCQSRPVVSPGRMGYFDRAVPQKKLSYGGSPAEMEQGAQVGDGLQRSALVPILLDVMTLQKVLSADMPHKSLAWGMVEV